MNYEEYQVTVYENEIEWRQNGELHRLDGPAVECQGDKYWYKNGKYHRLDGPAIEFSAGTKCWYKNGKRHRLDGPAVMRATGEVEYYQNGELHRLDGPAVEGAVGPGGSKRWYIKGKPLSEQEFNALNNYCEGKTVEIDGKKYRLTAI